MEPFNGIGKLGCRIRFICAKKPVKPFWLIGGSSYDEIKELEIIAKYSASESIKVESTQKRLLSFSSDQYKLMIIEAAKLIRKHRKHNSGAFFRRVTINNEFPDKLAFLNLDSISLLSR